MKTISYLIKITLLCVFASCHSSRYISTTWKNQHAYPGNYSRIMVFAIVNSSDSVSRVTLENHFVETFESYGYPAISSYSEFGTSLRNLDQEVTYRNLCEKGIDAVMTIAWVNKEKEDNMSYAAYVRPVEFFFNRMWEYKKYQAQIPSFSSDSVMKYCWEMILFDLPTLQPHYVAQTRTIHGKFQDSMEAMFWQAMIKELRKEKFLKKRMPVVKMKSPRAF